MARTRDCRNGIIVLVLGLAAWPAMGQSFRVQCPTSTITHPSNLTNVNAEPAYTAPTPMAANSAGFLVPTGNVNGAIKCQQIAGGDGYATMGDGTQTYMFSFGPLSGLADMANGKPGTQFPYIFNAAYPSTTPLRPGDPATTGLGSFTFNGAVGLALDIENLASIFAISEVGHVVTATTNTPLNLTPGSQIIISNITPAGYNGTFTVQTIGIGGQINGFPANYSFTYIDTVTGLAAQTELPAGTAATPPKMDGHVDARPIMDVGVMNGNIPAPLMAIDEDDEFFLTLSNVGMIMRPDLFEQHTVHFHGYPNASSFYDGVPDASVAINIAASFTYYYLAPDAGTYFWHCHISPPEHLQMGMVGQIYVRPRQNRVPVGNALYTALQTQQTDLRTACNSNTDILCSNPLPVGGLAANPAAQVAGGMYAYNDGDGSTKYDVEYPIQIHGFDPNFHFVGMTFNPEGFSDMKDKYFLLNGRSYPDTVTTGPMQTQSADGVKHFSQPLPTIINIHAGQKALLRISDLDVTEFQTLASLGIPMKVIGYNAKLLRDQAGNNLYYNTNSITLGGGESLDVILDTSVPKADGTNYASGEVYFLYTPNLDHLANDAENFGGLMTEIHII